MTVHVITPESSGDIDGDNMNIVPGDVIEFTGGLYSSTVKFNNVNGTLNDPVVVRVASGVAVFDSGTSFTFRINSDDGRSSHIVFDGSQSITNMYPFKFVGTFDCNDSDHITWKYCEFEGMGKIGLSVKHLFDINTAMSNFTVEDCYFHDCAEGLYIGDNDNTSDPVMLMDYVLIQHCVFRDNIEAAQFSRCRFDVEFSRNMVLATKPELADDTAYSSAVSFRYCDEVRCFRNIIFDCDAIGVYVNGDGDWPNGPTKRKRVNNNLIHLCCWGTSSGKDEAIRIESNVDIQTDVNSNTIWNVNGGMGPGSAEGIGIKHKGSSGQVSANIVGDVSDTHFVISDPAVSSDPLADNLTDASIAINDFVDPLRGGNEYYGSELSDFRLLPHSSAITGGPFSPSNVFYGSEGFACDVAVRVGGVVTNIVRNAITISLQGDGRGPRAKS